VAQKVLVLHRNDVAGLKYVTDGLQGIPFETYEVKPGQTNITSKLTATSGFTAIVFANGEMGFNANNSTTWDNIIPKEQWNAVAEYESINKAKRVMFSCIQMPKRRELRISLVPAIQPLL
jgi:hypothetical protein